MSGRNQKPTLQNISFKTFAEAGALISSFQRTLCAISKRAENRTQNNDGRRRNNSADNSNHDNVEIALPVI